MFLSFSLVYLYFEAWVLPSWVCQGLVPPHHYCQAPIFCSLPQTALQLAVKFSQLFNITTNPPTWKDLQISIVAGILKKEKGAETQATAAAVNIHSIMMVPC